MDYGVVIGKLEEIIKIIRENPRKAFPLWVYELDSCSRELASYYSKLSKSMGYDGKLKVDIPELCHLKQAIRRISGLCALGGFSHSINIVYEIILTTIEDLRLQEKLDGGV